MRISDWSSDVCSSDLLQVRPGLHISGTHFIGYLSHGCDPNCRLDMERFELVARRDIAPGETLTVDYAATEDVLFRQFACRCAAPTCRGWITGRAEAINEDGRSEEHTSELQSLMRISYAVFCLKKNKKQ